MLRLWQAQEFLGKQAYYKGLNAFISHGQTAESLEKSLLDAASRRSTGQSKSEVDGQLIAIKDNICTLQANTTCASNILNGFASPYSATVVEKLRAAGAIVVGKTNLDEFGMGSYSTHSAFGQVENFKGEANHRLVAGGSSGGSAVAVGTQTCLAALGTDTGGSVRLPASYTGTVGFKPSYGLLSRHGVIAYANSLDTVGIIAQDINIAKKLFDVVKGYDSKDPTSLSPETLGRIENWKSAHKRSGPLRIGIPSEYNIAELDGNVRKAWETAINALGMRGHSIHRVSLPATRLALSAYYIIAPAEAASNLAKYDGVRYGNSDVPGKTPEGILFASARRQGFGVEVRRRILLGAYSLSASAIDNYFLKAQRVRRLVQQDFERVFSRAHPLLKVDKQTEESGVDILLTPTTPTMPPKLADLTDQTPVDTYCNDVFTVPASLAGLPAITVPIHLVKEDHTSRGIAAMDSIGIQLIAQYGDDDLLLEVAETLESSRPRD